uniref:Lipoxygenase domain-containing protein n=1 Tax=Medicago truncatula TaxID=3880 RepID=B7FNB7_MEDTR|nr:unknown [Medicago truncatula]
MFPLFKKKQKIKGTVVLMCKNALDLNDIKAGPSLGAGFGLVRDVVGGVIDGATAILGRSVGLQLISATKTDRMGNGFVGDQFFLEKRIPFLPTLAARQDDGTLKPLAIELSLPHPDGEKYGAVSKVLLPPEGHGVQRTIWQLAKAYVVVNDACFHQLMSHWLNTHCVIEPFIIATNRCLSVVHPVHKLLQPHYRDTMNINALARSSLISGGGIIEQAFLPGPYAVEMSSAVYKDRVFPDQALPADLIKRGMAVQMPVHPTDFA